MAWPTATDVAARTGIACSSGDAGDETSYGVNVTTLLTEARAYAAEVCGRDPDCGFDETDITSELHDYDGTALVYVHHPPIIGTPTVELNDTTLSATNEDFYTYGDRGYVRLALGREWPLEVRGLTVDIPQAIEITYTGGYSDASSGTHEAIPTELKNIVLDIACRWLMKIDERYRQMKNATKVTVGEVTAAFPADEEMPDLLARLQRGRWNLRVW